MDAITDYTSMGVADAAYSRLRTDILGTQDAAEGLASFKEKRNASYVGR